MAIQLRNSGAHIEETPWHPRRFVPDISEDFVDIIADMMDKNPDKRVTLLPKKGHAPGAMGRLSSKRINDCQTIAFALMAPPPPWIPIRKRRSNRRKKPSTREQFTRLTSTACRELRSSSRHGRVRSAPRQHPAHNWLHQRLHPQSQSFAAILAKRSIDPTDGRSVDVGHRHSTHARYWSHPRIMFWDNACDRYPETFTQRGRSNA